MYVILNTEPSTVTSTQSERLQQWKLYPNPATGSVFLQAVNQQAGFDGVKVFDMRGRQLVNQQLPALSKEYTLTGFSQPGLYLVRLYQQGTMVETKKLLIE
jgi:hypothetical protein